MLRSSRSVAPVAAAVVALSLTPGLAVTSAAAQPMGIAPVASLPKVCESPQVAADPDTVPQGSTVTLSACGFPEGESVTVEVIGPSTTQDTISVDTSGGFTYPLTPAEPGEYTVAVSGTSQASTRFTVEAESTPAPEPDGDDPTDQPGDEPSPDEDPAPGEGDNTGGGSDDTGSAEGSGGQDGSDTGGTGEDAGGSQPPAEESPSPDADADLPAPPAPAPAPSDGGSADQDDDSTATGGGATPGAPTSSPQGSTGDDASGDEAATGADASPSGNSSSPGASESPSAQVTLGPPDPESGSGSQGTVGQLGAASRPASQHRNICWPRAGNQWSLGCRRCGAVAAWPPTGVKQTAA